MQKIFKSKAFYFSFIFSTIIVFIAMINFSRIYISYSDILVIAKSEKSALNSDQIVENLTILPFSLSFYDRMIGENEETVESLISELPGYKKKAYWNSKLKIERIGKSSILRITTSGVSRYEAEFLNAETVKELISSIGFYYDIQNDVDIRIIDNSITSLAHSKSNTILFLLSLFIGLMLSILSFSLSFSVFKKRKKERKIKSDFFKLENKIKERDESIQELNKVILQAERPWNFFKKNEVSSKKKASAPSNLPIAPDEFEKKFEHNLAEEKEEQVITREATQEEVKKRLNKLLSGKI